EVLELEDEIKEALDRVNETHRDTTLNRLEDVLRDVLRELAREDKLLLRSELASGSETGRIATGAATGGQDTVVHEEADPPDEIVDPGPPHEPDTEQDTVDPDDVGGPEQKVVDDPSHAEGSRRRRAGFDIRFGSFPPDAEGMISRSKLVDGVIYINT